jgi:N-acyl-L-homoserine lactone synthetase
MEILDLALAPDGAATALADMFTARKQVFVDLLGWELPIRDGRFEVDQFDDAKAAYVLLRGAGIPHRGSARLLKTEGPHILGDLFPSLCAGSVPRGRQMREITRFCIDPGLSRSEQREARNDLISALVLHAGETGITTYTAVAGLAWFRQISRFGWDCRALGEPQKINGEVLVGLEIIIGTDTVSCLAATGILSQPHYDVLSLQEGAWS